MRCSVCAADAPAVVQDVFSAGWEWQNRAVAGITKYVFAGSPASQCLQAAPRCKLASASAWQLALGSFVDANCTLMLSTAGN